MQYQQLTLFEQPAADPAPKQPEQQESEEPRQEAPIILPERPIWQAKRIRCIKNADWPYDHGYKKKRWYLAGKEYGCLHHQQRDTHYLLALYGPGDGVVIWSSDCNESPQNYRWPYKRDDAFFLEHFEIIEWDEEVQSDEESITATTGNFARAE